MSVWVSDDDICQHTYVYIVTQVLLIVIVMYTYVYITQVLLIERNDVDSEYAVLVHGVDMRPHGNTW